MSTELMEKPSSTGTTTALVPVARNTRRRLLKRIAIGAGGAAALAASSMPVVGPAMASDIKPRTTIDVVIAGGTTEVPQAQATIVQTNPNYAGLATSTLSGVNCNQPSCVPASGCLPSN